MSVKNDFYDLACTDKVNTPEPDLGYVVIDSGHVQKTHRNRRHLNPDRICVTFYPQSTTLNLGAYIAPRYV